MAGQDQLVGDLFRREAGRIAAWLARLLGPSRLDIVEDAVQEAFRTALARWPLDGMPRHPAGWLAVVARNRALDRLRHEARNAPFDEDAAWRLGFAEPADTGRLDDTLSLMFVACHPALATDEQTMLTLKVVCGFGVGEIARAYLSTPEAVTQRLVRAKKKIKELGLAFEIPEGPELQGRLPALLQAVYLLFNGGYTSGDGPTLVAIDLCAEALRLVELLTAHRTTATGEAHALAALVCFHHARAGARTGDDGALVTLARQDRSLWDRALIARGSEHLARATSSKRLTAFHLEAAIASVHATAPSFEETDWHAAARSYAMLEELKPTPVVRLNAAIAQAHVEGPLAGLACLDALAGSPRLEAYALFHAARGDLLERLGRMAEAEKAFGRALACTLNAAERDHLARRLRDCAEPTAG